MSEHHCTALATCPFCDFADRDSWEIDFGPAGEGDTTHTCGRCGEDYFLSRNVEVTYSSAPIAKATEASHG
jgi:hypothetical protein